MAPENDPDWDTAEPSEGSWEDALDNTINSSDDSPAENDEQ